MPYGLILQIIHYKPKVVIFIIKNKTYLPLKYNLLHFTPLDTPLLTITIIWKRCGSSIGPICKNMMPVYDTSENTWRHLDFFQHEAYIHFRTPRIECDEHGVLRIELPWGFSESGFTQHLESTILTRAKQTPVTEIAKELRVTDKRIWRVISRNIHIARAREDYSETKAVGLDETSRRKGHNYVTVFMDMDRAKAIYVVEGKDSETVKNFKNDLLQHSGEPDNIKDFSLDMSPAFIKGVRENFTQAKITFDKFHVISMVNEAVDETRRDERKYSPVLKSTRYIWLKNRSNLNKTQEETIQKLSKMHLKTARAYRIKLSLQDVYATGSDKDDADKKLKKWLSWANRSRLPHIKDVAKTIKKNFDGILNYFDSRLTNGLLEGTNSIIQAAKARAKGYRNTENLISMIYLLAGKLNFNFTFE